MNPKTPTHTPTPYICRNCSHDFGLHGDTTGQCKSDACQCHEPSLRTKIKLPVKLKEDERLGNYLADGNGFPIDWNCDHAAFIVRAVNAHEELLLLAKAYLADLKARLTEGYGPIKYAEEVIAKAKGK